MKQLTFQFEGFAPECVKETGISLQVNENVLSSCENLNTSVKQIIAAARPHALPMAGNSAFVLGVMLASGAQTVGAALISAAVFIAGAAMLFVDNKRKGGDE